MPLACFGLFFILLVIIFAIFAPMIAPYNPIVQDIPARLQDPSLAHLFGTDELGRDVFSRIIYGSRIILIVGIGSVTFGSVIGSTLGLVSAYFGGWTDEIIMRIIDALFAFPNVIIAIALVAVLGNSLLNITLCIGIGSIPFMARIVRSVALSVKEQDFITAARAAGVRDVNILFRHILPNSLAPLLVQVSLGMAYAILIEAALSFLGLGVPPPTPTWGMMLRSSFPIMRIAPLLSIIPGVFIFLIVLSLNFLGDALRDILDPRLRGLIR